MVNTCSVSGCRNASKAKEPGQNGGKVHMFVFPLKNEALLKLWLHNLRRPCFKPTSFSRICSLHFRDEDFKTERTDSNKWRRKTIPQELIRTALKPDAVPTVFKGVPKSLLKIPPKKRSQATSIEARRQSELQQAKLHWKKLQEADRLKSLDDLDQRLATRGLPDQWTQTRCGEAALLLNLVQPAGEQNILTVTASITINVNLDFCVSYEGKPLPKLRFPAVCKGNQLERLSQMDELLKGVKDFAAAKKQGQWLNMAEDCLSSFLSENVASDATQVKKVSFLTEQLDLILHKPSARRYSRDLILFAYALYTTSSQVYRQLWAANVLSLPSQKCLQNLIRVEGIGALDEECRRAGDRRDRQVWDELEEEDDEEEEGMVTSRHFDREDFIVEQDSEIQFE